MYLINSLHFELMRFLLNTLLFVAMCLALCTCETSRRKETIAIKYCSSCHLFPEPALLDKKSWAAGVLPQMSLRMGLDVTGVPGVGPVELAEILKALPQRPMVSDEEWKTICEYYAAEAPDSLRQPAAQATFPLKQFSASLLSLPLMKRNMLTMLRLDPFTKAIYVGTRDARLYRLDSTLLPVDSSLLRSPPSDMIFTKGNATLVACMGIMDPNDQPAGSIVALDAPATPLVDSLKRPVDLALADFDQDGDDDMVVSAFGNFTGGLYVMEKGKGGYTRHTVHSFPGTRKTVIRDVNQDGRPDILALLAQGDEQIALFTNRGNFRFSYSILLKFPPVYGSSFFELADFNGDGHDDILYTNGDNADYSAVLKPYHGIRIFINDGHNHFKEHWFHHLDGASMAHAADYDQDGDLDIAAISFFPDFKKHPEGGFEYLENTEGSFTVFSTPLAASARWITMESADIDDDGDMDILAGALAFPRGVPDSLFIDWGKKKVSMLVLRNDRYP
jgi:hypothetical protein